MRTPPVVEKPQHAEWHKERLVGNAEKSWDETLQHATRNKVCGDLEHAYGRERHAAHNV